MSLTVVIYLSDGCGEQFVIPNGNVTTASQYFQLMIANLKLPDALAKKCFALWLKSPLLGKAICTIQIDLQTCAEQCKFC